MALSPIITTVRAASKDQKNYLLGVGSFIGPVIAANVFFGTSTDTGSELDSVKIVYLVIPIIRFAVVAWYGWRGYKTA